MKIHHIGYLVKKIESSIKEFEQLGFVLEALTDSAEAIVIDNIRKVKIAFMKNGPYRIELVQPLDTSSPIYGLLKKYKNSPYHICYEAGDIDVAIASLEEKGWTLFAPAETAPAINGCKVAFLMGGNSGMLELVESSKTEQKY